MKRILLILIIVFLSKCIYASYIFNPGGGSTTLTDANGCVWLIGSTIDINGIVSTTLVSCPTTPRKCTTGMSTGLLLAVTCP